MNEEAAEIAEKSFSAFSAHSAFDVLLAPLYFFYTGWTPHLPVRPDLDQLQHQARQLLATMAEPARLDDAQEVLARSYGVASWSRLVLACRMTDAICRDDVDGVRALIARHPQLLHEDARGVRGNWGPPMSYAANLGRNRIIEMLRGLGADDLQFAFDRACLQGQIETAKLLRSMGARLQPGAVMGACETQNDEGLAFLLENGAEVSDAHGNRLAPAALVLETYCRNPTGKHRCLELLAQRGIALPDTPTMAVHRGRLDLLDAHLRHDAAVLSRTFAHEEIYPPELGCSSDRSRALHGTPLAGGTLLHLCVDYDEIAIAEWLIARGANVNARADVDADGFGGHTTLFGCVVVQSIRLRQSDDFARLLLDHGADPNARASLRKELRGADDETLHVYRDVTPLAWAERFHDRSFVSRPAMQLIAARGGYS